MNLHDYDITKEAFEKGMNEGLTRGSQGKAVDAAINLLKMNVLSDEQIAQAEDLPLEQVLELKKQMVTSV